MRTSFSHTRAPSSLEVWNEYVPAAGKVISPVKRSDQLSTPMPVPGDPVPQSRSTAPEAPPMPSANSVGLPAREGLAEYVACRPCRPVS